MSHRPATIGNWNGCIVIASRLADALPACSSLWWLLRGIDTHGSGKVEFTVQQAANLLHKDDQTIRRYLSQGKAIGLFRSVDRTAGRCTVYLASLFAVAHKHGIQQLGAFARVGVEDLGRLKMLATEIEAESLQRQSAHQKRKELKQAGRQRLSSIDRIFRLESSEKSRGAKDRKKMPLKQKLKRSVIHVGSRAVFVSSRFTVFGGSQAAIAKRLGRSDRTVRKRLSNTHRQRINAARTESGKPLLPLIRKKQVCQLQSVQKQDWGAIVRSSQDVGQLDIAREASRMFNSFGQVFRAGCNIYYLAIELTGKRQAKRRYKQFSATQERLSNTGTS